MDSLGNLQIENTIRPGLQIEIESALALALLQLGLLQ